MKAKDIQDILEKQLKQDGLQRIAINGEWGAGKTYQVDEFIKKHKGKKKLKENKKGKEKGNQKDKEGKKENKEEKLKIIKVSLFGKKSVEDINNAVYGEISKHKRFFREVLKAVSNISGSYKWFSLSIPDFSHLIGDAKFKEGKKVLVVFDDFERKTSELSVESIMGYIDNLCANNKSVKVAMIMCEEMYAKKEESKEQIEVFNTYKEKTFNKIFNIDSVDDESVRDIVDEYAKDNKFSNEISKYMVEHFLMLKSKNLRVLKEVLSELSLYKEDNLFKDIFKEERNQKNDDALKKLINCLINIVYDCKTNDLLEKHRKQVKQEKILISDFDENEDEFHLRTVAIMSKCQMAGVGANAKYDIINIMLRRYLLLDSSRDSTLKNYLMENSDKNNLYESLFYLSDKEAQKRALEQYQDILEKKHRANLVGIMNDWYENLDPKFIKENIDLNLLEDALIDGAGKYSFCFYETNWNIIRSDIAKPVVDFVNKFNRRVYCERVKKTCETLESGSHEAFVHMVSYMQQYYDQISKDNHLDPEIEKCFEKNKFFINKLNGTISQDMHEAMHSLFVIYRNDCSKECSKKFESILNKEIESAIERTYALRLKYLKNSNN